MKNNSCRFTHNSFFYNKGNIANCCAQESLLYKTNWHNVDDLNNFYKTNSAIANVRSNLDKHIQHPACRTCWLDEKEYGHSMRTNNNYYEVGNAKTSAIDITHVDLRLSNKCNLQCKMCSPYDSDQLMFLSKKLSSIGIKNPLSDMTPCTDTADIKKLLQLVVDLPNLQVIRFAGGEPFIMPEVAECLQTLINLNKTDLSIEFITNCTSAKTTMLDLLKQFKKIEIVCSLDGVGTTIEYQRYPSKWGAIEKNFNKIYECGFYNLSVSPCIGMLNYLTIDELFNWVSQYSDISVGYNEIYEPSFLNFRYIPLDVRAPFIERFLKIDITNGDPKWQRFKTHTMHEYLEPTQEDCNMLYDYVTTVWDVYGTHKFLDLYPWAEYMLLKAKKL